MKHLLLSLAALSCTLALTACGSSGGGNTTAGGGPAGCTSDIPQSAQADVSGLVGYAKQLVSTSSDTSEPLSTCNVTLPTDDNAEPSS